MSTTYILVAGNPGISNLVATAAAAGNETVGIVVGDREVADAVAASGVDKVVWLNQSAGSPSESYAPTVADIVAADTPSMILAASRPEERALIGAVAAKLARPVYTGITEIESTADGTLITHTVFGGISQETVKVSGPVLAILEGGSSAEGNCTSVEEVAACPQGSVTIVETKPAAHTQVNLSNAQKIVSVGRGLKEREDLKMIENLATALGAEIGCSRPLAEGLNWCTKDRYIGVTGQHVSPSLYVALGISGQLQHTVGARSADTVVVINTDKDAPYVHEADYAIIGDMYQVVPALIEALS